MILYFDNGNERREIGQPKDKDEAMKMISKFCEERNFTIPYVRTWGDDYHTHYDVGSWTQSFLLEHFNLECKSEVKYI